MTHTYDSKKEMKLIEFYNHLKSNKTTRLLEMLKITR